MQMHKSTFQYLKPDETQLKEMALVREAYEKMYEVIENIVPDGRYKSLAITALEESAMFANKAITRDSDGTPRGGAIV